MAIAVTSMIGEVTRSRIAAQTRSMIRFTIRCSTRRAHSLVNRMGVSNRCSCVLPLTITSGIFGIM